MKNEQGCRRRGECEEGTWGGIEFSRPALVRATSCGQRQSLSWIDELEENKAFISTQIVMNGSKAALGLSVSPTALIPLSPRPIVSCFLQSCLSLFSSLLFSLCVQRSTHHSPRSTAVATEKSRKWRMKKDEGWRKLDGNSWSLVEAMQIEVQFYLSFGNWCLRYERRVDISERKRSSFKGWFG